MAHLTIDSASVLQELYPDYEHQNILTEYFLSSGLATNSVRKFQSINPEFFNCVQLTFLIG